MPVRQVVGLLVLSLVGTGCGRDAPVRPGPADAPAAPVDAPVDAPPDPPAASLDARLLVVSVDGTEGALAGIRQALDFQATPYTLWVVRDAPGALTAAVLADGLRGHFQGVILASAELRGADGASALTAAEWTALHDYQRGFGVRQAALFTEPTAADGFAAATARDTAAAPLATELTQAGRAVFPYLTGALTIRDEPAFLAAPADAATVALLADADGHALVAVTTYPDGHERLALTFDGEPTRVATIALGHGIIDWVSRGLVIGERKVFAGPQVDDVFLGNRLFAGGVYRITGADLDAVAAWQAAHRARPLTAGLILTLAWNGRGTTGLYDPDTLTPTARARQAEFRWVSHSWSHLDLDVADHATAVDEIARNNALAATFAFDAYDPANIVTPGHTGLANPAAMRAAREQGVAYLISNTSRPGHDNPFPNVGFPNLLEPTLFTIPRHPTEIYFDVTTPAQEVGQYAVRHPTRGYDYDQILDKESDHLLRYMLIGDIDPWMFHQSNLRAYDGVHTLLGDVLDRTLTKYEDVYTLPVQTLAMTDLGAALRARAALHASGVTGVIVPGVSLTLSVDRDAIVPVTGLALAGAEVYGGRPIAHVRVTAGVPVTLSLR